MGLKVYLPIAFVAFVIATVGADVVALTTIGGQPFAAALHEHLYWARAELVGTMLLLAPFVAVALICARVEKRSRTRSAVLIFAVAMLALLYFYFQGYLGAERAAQQQKWTAASLSIGLLPFLIGIPVVAPVFGAGALAARYNPRTTD